MSDYLTALREQLGTALLMLPVVTGVIRDTEGRVLLQLRSDNHQWGLPGGMIEPDEAPAQALVREVYEETGLWVKPRRILGVFGGARARFVYPHGDIVEPTIILFECIPFGGELRPVDGESLELKWIDPNLVLDISGFRDTTLATLLTVPFEWDEAWIGPLP